MKTRYRTTALLILAVASALAAEKTRPATRARLSQEIEMLRRGVMEKPDSDENWKPLKPQILANLKIAREALDAGQMLLALDAVNIARSGYRATEWSTGNPAIVKGGVEAFMVEWKRQDAEIAKAEQGIRVDRRKTPEAVKAIKEINTGRVHTLYQSARGFVDVAGPPTGLYYLGNAKASLESAQLAHSVDFPSAGKASPERSIISDILVLQNEVLAAYKPPRSIDRHSDFIRINGAIKYARELDDAKLYRGAMYQYLEAVRSFADLKAEGDPKSNAELKAEAARYRTKIESQKSDVSIAELLLEKAEYRLANAGPEGKDAPARRTAQNILLSALPAYFAVREKPAVAPAMQGKLATVTLVRWPFT